MSEVETTSSEVVTVVKVKSAAELAAAAKQDRKAQRRLVEWVKRDINAAAKPNLGKAEEEKEEPEEERITSWDLANLRRLAKRAERGGSHSEVGGGKVVHYAAVSESNDIPSAPIKRHSISDATKRIRCLTENGGTNRQMRRAHEKLDRVLRAEENRKLNEQKMAGE